MVINKTKIIIRYPDGEVKIKPWASEHKDIKKHIQDAKNAYGGLLEDSKISIEAYI